MKLLILGLIGGLLAVGAAQAAPIRVQAEAQPGKVGIGDPVRYVVVARFPRAVDAASIRIFADAGPLVPTGPARTTQRIEGSALVVTLVQRVACLDLACAPTQGAHGVRLPAARVVAELPGRGAKTGRADPVSIVIAPRVSGADVRAATPPYRQQTALPGAGGRAGRLVTPLVVAAAAFVLVAALLAVLVLRPRSTASRYEPELARAVRLLRESAARPVSDRRRAADLVARITGAGGAPSVADDASRLAWSESSPKPEGTVALAERAEGTGR